MFYMKECILKRKLLCFIVSVVMILGLINCPSVQSYADEIVSEQITEEDSVWTKLSDFVASLDENCEIHEGINTTIVKEDNYVFKASLDDERIELILSENSEECVVYYSVDTVSVSGIQKVSEITNNLTFDICDMSEDEFEKYTSAANKLFSVAMIMWEETLRQADISFGDLGFVAWEKYAFEYNSDVESIDVVECAEDEETEVQLVEEDEETVVQWGEENEETEVQLVEEETVYEELLESPMPTVHAERIMVNYDSMSLRLKDKVKLSVSVFPENATDAVSFSSSNSSFVSVTSEGVVCAEMYTDQSIDIIVKAGSVSKKIPVTIEDVSYNHISNEAGNNMVKYENGKEYISFGGIWVGGFNKENSIKNVYTGKAVTQDLKVYDGNKELVLNQDYTLSYKNNVNAATYDQLNAPSVTIKMKGQYSGQKTLFYTIFKSDISWDDIVNNETVLDYTGKAQYVTPTVVVNGRKLIKNKDYIITYSSANPVGIKGDKETIKYSLTGIGNYKGSINEGLCYYIVDSKLNMSKASLKCNSSYTIGKYFPTPSDVVKAVNLQIKLPDSKEYVNVWECSDLHYTVSSNDTKMTIEVVDISGKYKGTISKTISLKHNKDNLANIVKIDDSTPFKSEIIYHKDNNKNIQKLKLIDTTDNYELVENVDYTVKCTGYNKAGTATLTYTGVGTRYKGTYKLTYKIKNESLVISANVPSSVAYVQGETKPIMEVKCSTTSEVLKENVDYTVKYTNNKNVGVATYKITGKGNYSKVSPLEGTYTIKPAKIGDCSVSVQDIAYSGKPGKFKSNPVVTAPNGKKLVAGKDYDKNIEYIYDDWDDPNSSNYNNPSAGSLVNVKITGIGNYTGTVYGCYRVYDSKVYSISKLYISIDNKEYTGKAVELNLNSDVHIYKTAADMKNKVNEISPFHASDYLRIISYKNNIKSGNATVTFGAQTNSAQKYGGTKSVTFKIVKKDYGCKSVSKVTLNKTSLKLTNYTPQSLKATLTPSISEVYNSTLIWKSSNTKVVKINSIMGDECQIEAVDNGQAVITCTSQDGNKVGKCTVNVAIKKPTGIVLNKSSLQLKLYETSQLNYEYIPADAVTPIGVTAVYSSSNESVATIDSSGKLKAVGLGIATINCTVGEYSANCFVEVESNGSLSYVNVTSFGATPGDASDDTSAINNAIKSALSKSPGERNVKIPAGTYNVSIGSGQECGIDLNNAKNLYIYMEDGAVIKNTSDKSNNMRGVFILDRAQNVIIEGGTVQCLGGSKVDEDYFGIMTVRSSDIKIKNVTVKNSKGDGIYLGKDNKNNCNNNVIISGCTVDGCIRNNIALVNATNVTIENCNLKNAKAYNMGDPYDVGGLGIDIEPNNGSNQIVKDVYIKNCTFSNNRSDFGIHCHVVKANCPYSVNVTLDGCSFDKLVYIQCGTNVKFINTVKKPTEYFDQRSNSFVFPQ